MVYPADRIVEIREAKKFGVIAEIHEIDFSAIMDRMRTTVKASRDHIEDSLREAADFDFYFGEAHFTGDYTLEVHPVGEEYRSHERIKTSSAGKPSRKEERNVFNAATPAAIKGKTIVIASGARPAIPAVKGIEAVEYLTNESALELRELPESMIIIGGGYIAVEFAHFFEAVGTKVTIVQRNQRLVPDEEPEVSKLLETALSRRMSVHSNTEAVEVRRQEQKVIVSARKPDGSQFELSARYLLVAAGRRSNADLLRVENTGVKTDERGYIQVDEYLETSKKDIWSFGDAIGKKMFRHTANREAELVSHNIVHGKKSRLNYLTVPHAVFSYPEIASVGLTEDQAVKLMGSKEILVGKAMYGEVARGQAMMETEGFTKAVVHRKSGKILGYHIIGPQASILIQEVVNAMAGDNNLWAVARGMHIHPALSEVVLKAFGKLAEPE